MRQRDAYQQRASGGAALPVPFALNPDWSFRFRRALVTLDGGNNVQAVVSEVNSADILAQATAADRPPWDATTFRREVVAGDGISDFLHGLVSFAPLTPFVSFVAGYASQNVTTAAGVWRSAGSGTDYWKHAPGGGAFRVQVNQGAGTVAGGGLLITPFWYSLTRDPTAAAAEVRIRDITGADNANTPDRVPPALDTAALLADRHIAADCCGGCAFSGVAYAGRRSRRNHCGRSAPARRAVVFGCEGRSAGGRAARSRRL